MELKKYTGAWHGTLPVVLTGSAIFGYFTYSIFKSMNPAGSKIFAYASRAAHSLRAILTILPATLQTLQALANLADLSISFVRQLAAFDIYNGVWDSADN